MEMNQEINNREDGHDVQPYPPCSPSAADTSSSQCNGASRNKDYNSVSPIINPFDSPTHCAGIPSCNTYPSSHDMVCNSDDVDDIIDPRTVPAELTPTRNLSKSVTFLASGYEVSPLDPFDSKVGLTLSPITGDSTRSLPTHLNYYNDYETTQRVLPIVRRHTTDEDGTSQSENTFKEDFKDNEPVTNQPSDESTEDNAYPNRYRYYCLCSDTCMRITRRLCRPHINSPSFLHCLCRNKLQPHHQRILCRSFIIIFMIITITFTLLDLLILHKYLHVWLDGILDWLAANPVAGGLSFIGIILIASLCFFPTSLLALGAGFVYIDLYGLGIGIIAAFLVCYSGCLLGAAICFARSRYLMRVLIQKFANRYPIVRAVDKAFETMGFRLFLLLRLSPAMPFNALNYIGGIVAIGFKDYFVATCIGIIPGLLWTIFVGATFGTINARGVDGHEEFESNRVRKGAVLGVGISLGVMGLIGTGIYARRELTKIILAEQALEQAETSIVEEDAIGPQRSHEELLVRNEYDMENPHLGESYHGNEDELSNHVDSEDSPNSDGNVTHKRDNAQQRGELLPHRDTPWSAEAIANELPIIPQMQIFRRKSVDHESPGNNNQMTERQDDDIDREVSDVDNDKTQQSKPFELHFGQRILEEIPYRWEKVENGKYNFTNRPRSNTDPIALHVKTSELDSSLDEEKKEEQNKEQPESMRKLHSMADFESIRALADPRSSGPSHPKKDEDTDGGLDREWFWIWD